MNKIIIHSSHIITVLLLASVVLNYWKVKLIKRYKLTLNNLSYGIFMSAQMFAVFSMVYFSTDPQTMMYLEFLEPFGSSSLDFWTVFGLEIIVCFSGLLLSHLLSIILFRLSIAIDNSLSEEIYNENLAPVLIHAIVLISFSILISSFILRPFLFEWVSGMVGLIPLN
jgi:hypothetical protein